MNWQAHLAFGIFIGIAVSFLFGLSVQDAAFFTAVCGASALLPDLDLRKSKASQMLNIVFFSSAILLSAFFTIKNGFGAEVFVLLTIALFSAIFLIDVVFRPAHRGYMHGLAFASVLFFACLALFSWLLASAFFLGYLSHLLADGCIKL